MLGLLIDDCQGTPLFGSRKFQNFCMRHRHVGDGLGCSIFCACQSYKSQIGGMPAAVRDNTTSLLLFRTKNDKVLKSIAEEVGDVVGEDAFRHVYETATHHGDHDFLFIDFSPKEPDMRFRRNFEEYIVPPAAAGAGGLEEPAAKRGRVREPTAPSVPPP